MRELPILFNTPMVQATNEGRKTVTRRVVKLPDAATEWGCANAASFRPGGLDPDNPSPIWYFWDQEYTDEGSITITSPYGQPGDLLYVRETFYHDLYPHDRLPQAWTTLDTDHLYYRADGDCCAQIPECQCFEAGKPKWRPSIHMPKWAARIWLEVTSVRVERVQEIDKADVMAEGVGLREGEDILDCHAGWHEPFAELWDSINAKRGYSWESNPWVWVVGFRRAERPS